MFSYEVKVKSVNSGKLKAIASLVLEGLIEVDGFKIYEGSKGLFVSVPSHKGTGKDEQGNQIEKYYDDVRFVDEKGEEALTEIKNEMLKQYCSATGIQMPNAPKAQQQTATRGNAAAAVTASKPQTTKQSDSVPPKPKKPLW